MRRITRSHDRSLFAAILVLILAASTVGVAAQQKPASTGPGDPAAVERGRYLVSILGCHDCHTPFKLGKTGPEPDMSRMLSGHPQTAKLAPPPASLPDGWQWVGAATNTAFAGPWGISYAFNLTPDMDTGLGVWKEAMFVDAIRTGKHMGGGRPILPPMPWPVYRNMTDTDLKAVFAYLRTIPPISNRVPEIVPPAAGPK
jgi:hypothetical protein